MTYLSDLKIFSDDSVIVVGRGAVGQSITECLVKGFFSNFVQVGKSNLYEFSGQKYKYCFFAGVSALRWYANSHPDEDRRQVNESLESLKKINAENYIIISTFSVNDDEPYGRNRLEFEINARNWVHTHKMDSTIRIIRLPMLLGRNIKKNVAYDLKTLNNLRDELTENEVEILCEQARAVNDVKDTTLSLKIGDVKSGKAHAVYLPSKQDWIDQGLGLHLTQTTFSRFGFDRYHTFIVDEIDKAIYLAEEADVSLLEVMSVSEDESLQKLSHARVDDFVDVCHYQQVDDRVDLSTLIERGYISKAGTRSQSDILRTEPVDVDNLSGKDFTNIHEHLCARIVSKSQYEFLF